MENLARWSCSGQRRRLCACSRCVMASQSETAEIEAILARASAADAALAQVLKAVFNKRWIGQQRFTTSDELDMLFSALGLRSDAHVLDIDSGLGGLAIYLARQAGCRVTGIEPSPMNVRLACDTARAAGVTDRVRFVLGDVLTSDVSAESFDAIVCHDALLTVADTARLFER
jgi:2-polyprenyl-3-methyl-5-hydroxy-6-metoxy-1,4-benzoquinol methylase